TQASAIAEPDGQTFRLPHDPQHVLVSSERGEGDSQLESRVYGLLESVRGLGQALQGLQGVVQELSSRHVGGPSDRLPSRLPQISHCSIPGFRANRMSGEQLDIARGRGSRATLQGFEDASVQPAPALLQEARVGHLVGQGVLERVLVLREEPSLVEKPSRLKPSKPRAQLLVGSLTDFSEQSNRDVP